MLSYLISIFLGIIFGIISGLTPGIHINLISAILISISTWFLEITSPIILVTFIVSMSITHTFVDFIPSIFLGAPDEDSVLSVLPGHQFLLKGHGHQALVLTLKGGLIAMILILLFTPIFINFLPEFYETISKLIPCILIGISMISIATEKEKIFPTIIFILSGFLGIVCLNIEMKEPLLPLLSGLFGASGILISLKEKTKIPKQTILPIAKINLSKKSYFRGIFASAISAPLVSFLPGIGSAQAAMIGTKTIKQPNQKEMLFILGIINTIVMGLGIITFYSIGKTRNGSAVAISEILPNLNFSDIKLIIFTMIFVSIISFFLTLQISKIISKNIDKINYEKISKIVLILLTLLILLFSGILGILVFITATATGILAIRLNVKRIYLMGCLIIPTILFYFL